MEHRTVSRAAAAEMMPLDETGKPSPLAGSNHMDQFVCIEDVDQHFVAWIRGVITLERNFTHKPHRCGIVLFEVPGHWFVYSFRFDKLDKSELHGVVTVRLFGFLLN